MQELRPPMVRRTGKAAVARNRSFARHRHRIRQPDCPGRGDDGRHRTWRGNRDDVNWMKHTLAWVDPDKQTVVIDYRPVHTYTMSNDIGYIEPKARVY